MGNGRGRADRSITAILGLVLFALATIGVALVVIKVIGQGEEGPALNAPTPTLARELEKEPVSSKPPPVTSAELARAVAEVKRDSGLGDTGSDFSVVLWGRDWEGPSSYQGDVVERLWSLSKPVIVLATLRQGTRDGSNRSLVEEAIQESSNCATRSLVLDLEGESPSDPTARQGVNRFEEVLAAAGIELTRGPQVAVPQDDGCAESGYPELENSEGAALPLFGTAEWTSLDAARFMRALGDLGYGKPGEELLRLMGSPKAANQDPGASCDPGRPEPGKWEWGIGKVFRDWDPVYKSGWGGGPEGTGPVMFSQMGLVGRRGEEFALAVSLRLPEHLGGDPGSQCVTLGEIELVEELLERVRNSLATGGATEPQ